MSSRTQVIERFGKGEATQTAAIEGLFDLAEKLAGEGAGIIKTLLQAATVNPFLGVVASWIIADILQKGKLIFPSTNVLIKATGLIVFGVNLTSTILNDISNFIEQVLPDDFLHGLVGGNGAANTQALSPSASTIVYAGDPQALESLIAKLAAVQKK